MVDFNTPHMEMNMDRTKIAERLVKLAKEIVEAGEVPEAFKKQWEKNKKGGEVPEAFKEQWEKNKKGGEVPEAFKKQWEKNKKSSQKTFASELVKLAKELASADVDSPYKTKVDLEKVRRDLEHRSIRVLNAVLNLGPKAKLIRDQVLIFSEGTSHKFHFFALYDDNGTWKAGNAYGRIGGEPKGVVISTGDKYSVQSDYSDKLWKKKAKGYQDPAEMY